MSYIIPAMQETSRVIGGINNAVGEPVKDISDESDEDCDDIILMIIFIYIYIYIYIYMYIYIYIYI